MHKAAGEFMREWNQAIDEDDRCAETMAKGAKRAVVQVDEEDLADVQGSWEKGKLDKVSSALAEVLPRAPAQGARVAGLCQVQEWVDGEIMARPHPF
jgi:hypothetical protein